MAPHADHDYERYPEIEAEIGENPARYLDADLLMDKQAKKLFKARLRGIRKQRVAALWLQVEHRLNRDDCPRSAVVEMLEQKAREIQEHGDRVPTVVERPRPPFHLGSHLNEVPPKHPAGKAATRLQAGAARHHHYAAKAAPFLEARDTGSPDSKDGGNSPETREDAPAARADGGQDPSQTPDQ